MSAVLPPTPGLDAAVSPIPEGPPSPPSIQPVAQNFELRDVKAMLDRELQKEWYRANQAGHATGDYSSRDLVMAHIEMVKNWEPAAPAGGISPGNRAKVGQQVRPPAVERADLLNQIFADFPQLGHLLRQNEAVHEVLKSAQQAQDRIAKTQPSSGWKNPFANAAGQLSPWVRQSERALPSQSAPVPAGLQRTAPTTIRRAAR